MLEHNKSHCDEEGFVEDEDEEEDREDTIHIKSTQEYTIKLVSANSEQTRRRVTCSVRTTAARTTIFKLCVDVKLEAHL